MKWGYVFGSGIIMCVCWNEFHSVAGGVTVYVFCRKYEENYSYIFAIYVTDNLLDINILLEYNLYISIMNT